MTDPRLDEALRRAAETLKGYRALGYRYPGDEAAEKNLEGWAAAIQAHAERPESEHDGGCSAGISKAPCKCSQRDRVAAAASFIAAMLGGDDEQH